MKIALLAETGRPAQVLDDGSFLDLGCLPEPDRPETVLEAARAARTLRAALANLPDATAPRWRYPATTPLLAPLPRPNRVLAIGRNYADHARELGNAVPDEPVVFLKSSTSVIGPDQPIVVPGWVGRVDFEGELLVILGDGGKDIPEADALSRVCGYTGFNDVTAREKSKALQGKGHPWFLAKSMDTFGPMGPVVVSADQIPDPARLRVTLTVNGEIRQNASTDAMIHSVPALIAFLSRWTTLEAGDVIATGTPSGVGPIVPGDTVSVTIAGIGTLSNPVVAG
jgi:2-keto-4-pentenoate hydratase/2-oxohepta-3-ene-1,7-dioic acid hydratase in catechol pathway